jgi:hypothetical protein
MLPINCKLLKFRIILAYVESCAQLKVEVTKI